MDLPRALVTRRVVSRLAAALVILALGASLAQGPQVDLDGRWSGAIDPDGIGLGIVLHIETTSEGLTVRLDVPPQGAFDLPVEVEQRGPAGELVLIAPTLPASPVFDGTVEGDVYAGTFTQGPASLPFAVERTTDAAAEDEDPRPQIPQAPFPYDVEEVTFPGAAGTLAGTLVTPSGDDPAPVVVLLNGSGAQDRDSTVFGHPILWVVADHLARAGIGSLRWDDRGVGGSEGDLAQAGLQGLAADALAAVEFLAGRSDVDADRIALLGHSEGGVVVPLAVTSGADVAAAVLMAAPAVPGPELLAEQNRIILSQAGASDTDIEEQLDYLAELAELLRAGDLDAARDVVRARVNAQLDALPEGQAPTGDERTAFVEAQVENGVSPAFVDLFLSDPEPVLRRISVPTLAVFFELDVQVPAAQNEGPMREALNAAGVRKQVVTIDGTNHLMQPAVTGGLEEYGANRITVHEEVLALLAQWLGEQLGVAP